MSRQLILKPDAELDLKQAYRWYEEQRSGLGQEFLEQTEVTLERIRLNPKSGSPTHRECRLALTRRFPYVICYLFDDAAIYVVAIYHGHRDPSIWRERL